MTDKKAQEEVPTEMFPNAISVEALKQHDPSVTFSCRKLEKPGTRKGKKSGSSAGEDAQGKPI